MEEHTLKWVIQPKQKCSSIEQKKYAQYYIKITTPISITSGIFYTNSFVKARGHAIL